MYKLLLVDDEYLIRESISKNTPWETKGFTLIGAVENGKEAIPVIEKEMPDVVLTDICMPVMDGIALAKYIHEQHPAIKVVMISGYDDFEYAKQALVYNVLDYLLKPITGAELLTELEKVKEKLDTIQKNAKRNQMIAESFEKNLPIVRGHFLNRILQGNEPDRDFTRELLRLGISDLGDKQTVIVVAVADHNQVKEVWKGHSMELLYFSIANITQEIFESYPWVYFVQDQMERSIGIVTAKENENVQEKIRTLGDHIIQCMGEYLQLKVCILVGSTVKHVNHWHASYEEALSAEEYTFLLENPEYVYGSDFKGRGTQKLILDKNVESRLLLEIKLNHEEEIKKIVEDIFSKLRTSGMEKRMLLIYVQNLLLTLIVHLAEYSERIQTEIDTSSLIGELTLCQHLKETQSWFQAVCLRLSREMVESRESSNRRLAVMAMDYIDQNYCKEDLSLNAVCDYLGVSTSYFSTVFKEACGDTFIKAVTKKRMKKAKQLLEMSDKKSYEVAWEVGYNDPHYFSAAFKAQTGMTPTEYVKQFKKNRDET